MSFQIHKNIILLLRTNEDIITFLSIYWKSMQPFVFWNDMRVCNCENFNFNLIVHKSYPKTYCGMFVCVQIMYVTIRLSSQWDQGSVMTGIQGSLAKQQLQHKHSTILMEKKCLTITLTLILTWSSDRSPPLDHSLLLEPLWNPVHGFSLHLIFIFHSLSLSLSHLRSNVCHPYPSLICSASQRAMITLTHCLICNLSSFANTSMDWSGAECSHERMLGT